MEAGNVAEALFTHNFKLSKGAAEVDTMAIQTPRQLVTPVVSQEPVSQRPFDP